MMKKYFCFFAFLAVMLHPSYSQNVWFQDDFNDNSKGWGWSDYDGEELTRKIADGKYFITHRKNWIYWSTISIFTDPKKPFEMETNIVQTESAGNNGFGLLLCGSDSKYYYYIINPSTKSFWVGTEHKGTWTSLYKGTTDGWQRAEAISPMPQSNNLKIQNKDGFIYFLINNTSVYTGNLTDADYTQLPGNSVYGLVTCTTMKIEVDDFIFRQENPPVNLVKNLTPMKKTNLGSNVNSKYAEKCPVISADGKTLFYVVQNDPENVGTEKKDDIYFSEAINDSTWGPRHHFGAPLNNSWPNAVISVTPDNNTLLLMHTYYSDGSPKAAGFSMSYRTAEGWSVPKDVVVKNYYNNGGSNEFCLSADRKALLMTVKRDDSYGSNDIYVSFLQANGEFSEPLNLGSTVNTFAWEASPFLAADGITLYYSTAGFPGYGSADIYMTRRLDSTWTNWSTPENLGPDINSSGWEAYYTIPASGDYAYVISDKESIEGSIDINRIKLSKALKPKPVVLIHGKVLNNKTKEPIGTNINYNLLVTNKEVGIASSSAKDGSYKIILPAGDVYSFLARQDGFYSIGENIDLKNINEYKEIERDLFLSPLIVGESIRLNNLFFDFNKAALRQESYAELDRVIKILKDNPGMEIEVSGHTDNIGTDAINIKLSDDRAAAVKNYLISQGIAAARVVSKGYGKSKPVAANTSDEGRQKNRRVEFTILKK